MLWMKMLPQIPKICDTEPEALVIVPKALDEYVTSDPKDLDLLDEDVATEDTKTEAKPDLPLYLMVL